MKSIAQKQRSLLREWQRDFRRFRRRDHFDRVREAVIVRTGNDGQAYVYSLRGYIETRTIFVHIPKAAGMSINAALYGNAGAGHRKLLDYRMILGRDFWSYFAFTFVRNPYSRLVSAYDYLMKGGHPAWDSDRRFRDEVLCAYPAFADFVLDRLRPGSGRWPHVHFRPQVEFLMLDGGISVDFIGCFEAIDEDFSTLVEQLGMSGTLPKKNLTPEKRESLEAYYDDDMVTRRVQDVYADDFAKLGYSLEVAQALNAPASAGSNRDVQS